MGGGHWLMVGPQGVHCGDWFNMESVQVVKDLGVNVMLWWRNRDCRGALN